MKDTKTRLLEAALALHAREGLEGVTVHAVVAASGVSLGSLYHHYGSFTGLLATLYARSLASLIDGVADAVEPHRTARGGIRALVTSYLDVTETRVAEARFVHAASYAAFVPEHASRIAGEIDPRVERLFAWARPFVATGELVRLPPPIFEALVIGPVAEVARRWLAGAPGVELDAARASLPERVWRSVQGHPLGQTAAATKRPPTGAARRKAR